MKLSTVPDAPLTPIEDKKQEKLITTLYGFGSSCAGIAALATLALETGDFNVRTAHHIANMADRLEEESKQIAELISLYTPGE